MASEFKKSIAKFTCFFIKKASKFVTPLLRISKENSRGRVKLVGVPGGIQKFERKMWISKRVNAKKMKNSKGVMI